MVEEECRRYRPTKNYLEHLPPLNISSFETQMMRNEFERIQSRTPLENFSMKRYELPPPPSGKVNEIGAWQECVDNSEAQLKHQGVRIMNLNLMIEYYCPTWQRFLQTIVDTEKVATAKMVAIKQSLQELNSLRKANQMKVGEELKQLEAKWVQLVSHNYSIEEALCKAEEIISTMEKNPDSILTAWKEMEEMVNPSSQL